MCPSNFQMSFLIPPNAIPGRLTMLVTLFLCEITTLNSVAQSVVSTEEPTVMVRWIFLCLAFIFLAILAYAWILFRKRLDSHCKEKVVAYCMVSKKMNVVQNSLLFHRLSPIKLATSDLKLASLIRSVQPSNLT